MEKSEEQKMMELLNELHEVIEKHKIDSDSWYFVFRALKLIHGGLSEESHEAWVAQKGAEKALELLNKQQIAR